MSSNKFIPLSIPNLGGNEWEYVKECLDTNWVSSVGSYVTRFEEELAKYVGAGFGVATSNGTSALHVAMKVCGVTSDDYVIVPNLTFIASPNSVVYNGSTPIFLDVNRNDWQLDVNLLEEFLEKETEQKGGETVLKKDGKRIKAVMPVHMFGNTCDMDKLMQLSEQYSLVIVEDATEALGSTYKGRPVGNIGHMGCFSFNGNKIMTTGGGGMIVSNDEAISAHAKHLTTQAKADPFEYLHDEIGFNYRLVNILAALGVAQLEQLPSFVKRKQEIAQYYYDALTGVGDIEFMTINEDVVSNQWLFTLLSDKQKSIFETCTNDRIQVRPIWMPMSKLVMYKDHLYYQKEDVSAAIHARSVSLPCSSSITDEELERVVKVVKSVY
jgi:aminotransferase in exopolysaccharide biosynthesis